MSARVSRHAGHSPASSAEPVARTSVAATASAGSIASMRQPKLLTLMTWMSICDMTHPSGSASSPASDPISWVYALGALGFGALEIGTVTPRPQPGNPSPRVFRLPRHGALINRLGFNNAGVDHLVRQVERRRWRGPLGINVGKNAATPIERAADDYVACLERVHPHADWVTVNVSSPNTANLRELQHGEALARLLTRLKTAQSALDTRHGRHVPLAVKIAPDMTDAELDAFCAVVREHEIEAVISGNTTRERAAVAGHLHARETGGLSGAPLKGLADDRLRAVAERLEGSAVALIGVGGIASGADAADKLALGADLVQLYSGLIFHGPALVRDCIAATTATTAATRGVTRRGP